MEYYCWTTVQLVSIVVHIFWAFIVFFLISKIWTKDFFHPINWSVIVFMWLVVNIFFEGCPLSYWHEYVDVKRGVRQEIEYSFEDSIAHKYIIKPISENI
ncbi:hypothetical protein ACFL2R_00690 [Patescibacteria group bacterium]